MSLKSIAEKDLRSILGSKSSASGDKIILVSPDGVTEEFSGISNDVAQAIDPETGAIVSGRSASASIVISDLYRKKMSLPKGIADQKSKPWIVKFTSVNGETTTFKVVQSNPDRSIGLITLHLELYDDNDPDQQAGQCRSY